MTKKVARWFVIDCRDFNVLWSGHSESGAKEKAETVAKFAPGKVVSVVVEVCEYVAELNMTHTLCEPDAQ